MYVGLRNARRMSGDGVRVCAGVSNTAAGVMRVDVRMGVGKGTRRYGCKERRHAGGC